MHPCTTEPTGAEDLLLHVVLVDVADVYAEYVEFTPVMILWLRRLKASPVSWSFILSVIGISRETRKSKLLKPGPMILLRPICGGRPVVARPELELMAPPKMLPAAP